MNVANIRALLRKSRVVATRGSDTVEIVGASFLADEDTIFGLKNEGYIEKELEWYQSQSLKLFSDAPSAWQLCAGQDGSVNSNYGWCMFSEENGSQYEHVLKALQESGSRRATAIYTRPTMHIDAFEGGKQDFMCTNAVCYFLREDRLSCVVQMRSSDAVLGYRNDRAWHMHVLQMLATATRSLVGDIHWQAGSLHVYERHFKYLEGV